MDMTRTTLTKLSAVREVVYSRSRMSRKGIPGKNRQNKEAGQNSAQLVVRGGQLRKLRWQRILILRLFLNSPQTIAADRDRTFLDFHHAVPARKHDQNVSIFRIVTPILSLGAAKVIRIQLKLEPDAAWGGDLQWCGIPAFYLRFWRSCWPLWRSRSSSEEPMEALKLGGEPGTRTPRSVASSGKFKATVIEIKRRSFDVR